MGEARRKKEAGTPLKIYSEQDFCPACGKTCASMEKEHAGKLITISDGAFFVCWRCGNMFMPQSKIKHFAVAAGRVIVDPNSPEGQSVQRAASKLVIPGGK